MTKRILIVDDSHISRAWSKKALESAGYEIETAEDIRIVSIVNEFKPDLILMDVELAAHDGATTAKMLKTQHYGQDAKIILYSAKTEEELAELTQRAGADGYIKKPGDMESLRESVAGLF